jgi:UDP-2,3-diacylglucosamine hydrolase
MSAALFISDLHLCPTRPAIARLFLDFLAQEASNAGALYLLGDLFDYWAGDDDLADPFNASIVAALKALAGRGTRLYFLAGNRDFLIGPDFARATGVTQLIEPHLATICGEKTLLLHGDTLCSDDTAYQEFRREVRSQAWTDAFLARPLSERRAQIAALRVRSEQAKQGKTAAIMDVNAGAVADLLRAHGYPRLIHGHTHRPGHHEQLVDGHRCQRWVLGDWYDQGSTLVCDEQGCRALSLPQA